MRAEGQRDEGRRGGGAIGRVAYAEGRVSFTRALNSLIDSIKWARSGNRTRT